MRVLNIALFGMLAVSAASYLFLREPAPIPEVQAVSAPEFNFTITEKPMESFQSLETPIHEKKHLHGPTQINLLPSPVVEVVVQEAVPPVETIEERGDAMLFEADALSFMPFDTAIVMPFD